jgi:hypothetical protein
MVEASGPGAGAGRADRLCHQRGDEPGVGASLEEGEGGRLENF